MGRSSCAMFFPVIVPNLRVLASTWPDDDSMCKQTAKVQLKVNMNVVKSTKYKIVNIYFREAPSELAF